jgi:hypothetical protein
MAELAVIYKKKNIKLFAFNNLVGDTWIIGIYDEINVRLTLHELPIVQ